MKRIVTLLLLMLFVINAWTSTVNNLVITLKLHADGSASVVENWEIDASGKITEWYLVANKMGDMEFKNFTVTEEGYGKFITEQNEWDTERSLKEKAHRCGIIKKGEDNYELCWGIGSKGLHKFHVAYTLTNLIKAYPDADGIGHWLMSRNIKANFKAVKVIVNSSVIAFTNDNVEFWSFGFIGRQYLDKGSIILEPNMSEWKNNGIALMCRFPKGLFQPISKGQGTFEEVKQKALEGSGFIEKEEEDTGKIQIGILLSIFGISIVSLGIEKLIVWIRRRKLGEIGWSEKIPYNGDLLTAFKVYNDYSYSFGQQTDNLVSAVVLRLINNGSLKLHVSDKKKYELEVLELNPASDKLESMVFNLIKNASGDDLILQKNEMRKFLSKHNRYGTAVYKRLTRQAKYDKKDKESICDVLALERYLKEFTDIKNKDSEQLSQWKEYMVYAQLFGLTDRVKKQLKHVWPDYFEQSEMPYYSYYRLHLIGKNIFNHSSTSANGGAGSSSFGGGGGFSGGGAGGGGR